MTYETKFRETKLRLVFLFLLLALYGCSSPREMLRAATATPALVTPDVITPLPTYTLTLATPALTNTEIRCYQVAADALHLRQSPDAEGRILDWLLRGDQVIVLDGAGGLWWHVQWSGKTGYVNSTFLEVCK